MLCCDVVLPSLLEGGRCSVVRPASSRQKIGEFHEKSRAKYNYL